MAKKKPETRKTRRYLQCNLTQDELLTYGKRQADCTIRLEQLESDRKRIADDFKAKISAVQADAQLLASAISSGYEHRDVPCTEYLGDPEPDKKRIIRDDTGEQVSIERLDASEMQRELLNAEGANE